MLRYKFRRGEWLNPIEGNNFAVRDERKELKQQALGKVFSKTMYSFAVALAAQMIATVLDLLGMYPSATVVFC